MFSDNGRPIWSVTELTYAIKDQLEGSFPSVRVEGEISNCRPSGAGHVYFSLKDSDAVISAALFRGRALSQKVKPENGMQVIVSGKIDVYPPRGSYQIIVENLEPAGKGALLEELERRKQRLAWEGLFDQERKKPLPPYPRRIAVVTSPTGAAIRDILQVLERRAAAPHITVVPTPVQGTEAPQTIADQIRRAWVYGLGDVVILARGGGSLEDLMCFNSEVVVRAVAECPLPIISGVGHEIDVSLADLAADVRASTPSAAAELVSDRSEDLLLRSRGFRRENTGVITSRIESARAVLKSLKAPELARIVNSRFEMAIRATDDARNTLNLAIEERVREYRGRFDMARRSLSEASPKDLMMRGYTRVSMNGRTITDAGQLTNGDRLQLQFAVGEADVEVKGTSVPKDER